MKRLTHGFLIIALMIATLRAIGTRYFNEDLFLGFCSGRDTLNGLMGKPDVWSFNAGGRVWVDNSWLSYLVYYMTYMELGDIGPVLVKTLLLIATLAVVYFRSIRLGISPLSVLLAMLLATLSVGQFLVIRGDNFALLYLVVLLSFLTGQPEYRRRQQIGTVAVMALWSNGHGSFPYGFFLILARFALELLTAGGWLSRPVESSHGSSINRSEDRKSDAVGLDTDNSGHYALDVKGWFITVLASGAALILLTPHGFERIVGPVRRTMVESFIINYSGDWVSILQSLSTGGMDAAVVPFVFFLGALILASIIAATCDYSLVSGRIRSLGAPVFVMLLIAAVPMTLMAFKYQRLIVLASFALVPLSALLFGCVSSAIKNRFARRSDRYDSRLWSLGAIASALLVCFLSVQFYHSMVIRYLPGNPFRDDKPLAQRLMSFPAYTMEVYEFMKRNDLSGRIFAGWEIATLALFRHPGIEVFMDCRDSAFYDDVTMRAFLQVLYSGNPDRDTKAASILGKYGVSFVLVTSHQLNFAIGLMKTKQWLPAYVDDEAILLTVQKSPIGEHFTRTNSYSSLHYDNPATRTVTESLAWLFVHGAIPAELVRSLKQLAQQRPRPLLYTLIASAEGPNVVCNMEEPRAYFEAELDRLMALSAEGPRSGEVVQSRIRVLDLLSMWGRKCERSDRAEHFLAMKREQETILKELMERYY
jgi:hypothetical protein